MKPFLKKILFFSVIISLYFIVTASYNYSLDPYGIIGTRKEFNGVRPNSHSLKVNHVLRSGAKYNSFLFSNSKGGILHFNQLNNDRDSWYNMTYSLGTPEEFLADILLFLENNIKIKNIVVGLDESTIYERASTHKNQASRKFISIKDSEINWEYLFLPISINKNLNKDLSKKYIAYDFFNDGNYYEKNAYAFNCDSVEKLIMVSYAKESTRVKLNFSSKIETFKKIKSLCNKHNIDLTFMVHPSSYDNYHSSTEKRTQLNVLINEIKNSRIELFEPFEQKLIINNSCYWRDNHHYTKKIGDSILQLYKKYKFEKAKNNL